MHSFAAVEAEKEAEERRLLIPGGKPAYQCVRCGALNEVDIQPRPAVLRCVNCGYPVLKKPHFFAGQDGIHLEALGRG
jgi:DNA-directed RNA polymerase subunit RPC12/RpoP